VTATPTFGVPSQILPATDPKSGKLASVWYQFLVRLAQLTAESPMTAPAVGASPYTFTAVTIGNLFITGGTVSSIVLTRSGVSITCQKDQFIPMAAGDTVTTTYTVAPTMTFVPSARA
jgi:hypothetical protein